MRPRSDEGAGAAVRGATPVVALGGPEAARDTIGPASTEVFGSPEQAGGGLSPAELQRRSVKGALWTAVSTFATVPLAFVGNLVVARLIGPVSYGTLAVLSLVLGLSGTVSSAGVNVGVLQWASASYARGDEPGTVFLLQKGLGWHLLVQLPAMALVVVVLGATHGPLVVAALLVGVVMSALCEGAVHRITVENRSADAARLAIAGAVILQVAVVVTAALTRDATAVWAARVCAGSLILPFFFLLVRRPFRRPMLRPRLPHALPKGFWSFALFTTAAGLLGTLTASRSEVFGLEAFHRSAAVGLFALAYGLAGHLTAPIDAMLGPLGPAAAGLLGSSPERARQAFLRALRYSALGTGALTASLLPAISLAVPFLYGSQYRMTALLVIPMGVASAVGSLANPVTAFLSAHRQARFELSVNCGALALDLSLTVLLIPLIGVWGAVVANIATGVVPLPLYFHREGRLLDLRKGEALRASRAWLAGVVALAPALLVGHAVPGDSLARAAAAALAGGLFFAGVVRLSSAGLAVEDRRPLLAALPGPLRPAAAWLLAILGSPVRQQLL